jgi:hypothetical protein
MLVELLNSTPSIKLFPKMIIPNVGENYQQLEGVCKKVGKNDQLAYAR